MNDELLDMARGLAVGRALLAHFGGE